MPISQNAIDRYLQQPPPVVPPFKGAPPERLLQHIRDSTGADFVPTGKTAMRKHQLDGVAFSLWANRALLLYSMQLGKSALALNWAEHLRRSGHWRGRGLVIAHAPVGLDVWQAEVAKHSNLTIACVRSQEDELMAALDSNADLIAIPWTGLQTLFSIKAQNRKGRNQLYPAWGIIATLAGEFSLCIIDEIHRAKNHTSLWFNIAAPLVRNCQYRLGLTGTPIGRNPLAIWSQAFLIDGGRALGYNYYFFEQAFSYKKPNWFSPRKMLVTSPKTGKDDLIGYDWAFDMKKLPILHSKLTRLAITYERNEVLPSDIVPNIVELPMTKLQQESYDGAVQHLIQLHKTHGPPEGFVNSFIRLRQIASGFVPYSKDGVAQIIEFPGSAKLLWLVELLHDLAGDARVVVFHDFTHSGQMICRELRSAKISHTWLYGGTKDPGGAVQAFKTGKAQVLVANAATGGMSINLSEADYLIYYESPVSPITRAQADARPMADRGTRPLLIEDLVCSNVERRILSFIREGKNALRELTRDPASLLRE